MITELKAPAGAILPGELYTEAGGHFLNVMPAIGDAPAYGLILLPGHDDLEFCQSFADIPSANSDWDGLANTEALLNSGVKHPAAEWARAQAPDAYLMAPQEALLAYASAPHLFEQFWHWLSKQYSPYYAFVQAFSRGDQTSYVKNVSRRARAVRRVLILR